MVNGWLMDNGWCTQCHLQDGHHVGCSPRQGDPGVALETPETPRRPVDGWRWSSNDVGKNGWLIMIRRDNNKSTNYRFVNFGGLLSSSDWGTISERKLRDICKRIIVGLRNLLLTRIWLVLLVGHAEGQMPQRVWILNKLFNSLFTAFWTHHIVVDFIHWRAMHFKKWPFQVMTDPLILFDLTCLRTSIWRSLWRGPEKTPCHHPNAATRSRSGSNPAEKCHGCSGMGPARREETNMAWKIRFFFNPCPGDCRWVNINVG